MRARDDLAGDLGVACGVGGQQAGDSLKRNTGTFVAKYDVAIRLEQGRGDAERRGLQQLYDGAAGRARRRGDYRVLHFPGHVESRSKLEYVLLELPRDLFRSAVPSKKELSGVELRGCSKHGVKGALEQCFF